MNQNHSSPRIKEAAKLLKKRDRMARGEFLVEGPQAVRELLTDAASQAKHVYITEESLERHSEFELLTARADVRLEVVPEKSLLTLSDTVTPQGIVAVSEMVQTQLQDAISEARLVAIMHEIRDPGNAGTVLRAADAAGADCVIFSGDSIDPWHPKVVRATTGSLFHLDIVVAKELGETVSAIKKSGLTVIAADVNGSDLNNSDSDLAGPVAWVFGNEARGLTETDLALADKALKLPIYGKAESLNLATAASVCLYTTAFAQRQ